MFRSTFVSTKIDSRGL